MSSDACSELTQKAKL